MKHIAFHSKYRKDKKKRSIIGKRNIAKRWERKREENDFRPDDIPLPITVMTWIVVNHITDNSTTLEFRQAFKKNGKPLLGRYEIFQNGKLWKEASKTKALSLISQRCPRVNFGAY